ncbi:MAG: hypothetical protein LHW56_00915 [Candidatus Cloacimonetes bacterium]|nr:hypothetical protein [Candidatus Cloacimonadota bacterium]MDY0171446.1 hypothetical protein [Candidatus Cloacimonadaceae bacterium]
MNYEEEQYPDYSSCEDHDLKRLFEQAETDSEAYSAIMLELTHRGYDFEPESDLLITESPKIKKRSTIRLWNLLGVVIGIALTIFYLQIHAKFYQIQSSTIIMIWGAFALIISMLYVGNGIRAIIQFKDPEYQVPVLPEFEYWFLAIFWFAASAFEMYSAIRALLFFMQNEAGVMFSMYGILPSLAMGAFALFLALAFLYIALEINKAFRRVENE